MDFHTTFQTLVTLERTSLNIAFVTRVNRCNAVIMVTVVLMNISFMTGIPPSCVNVPVDILVLKPNFLNVTINYGSNFTTPVTVLPLNNNNLDIDPKSYALLLLLVSLIR